MKYIFSKLSELLSNSKATFSKLGEQISFDNIELPNLSELITADNIALLSVIITVLIFIATRRVEIKNKKLDDKKVQYLKLIELLKRHITDVKKDKKGNVILTEDMKGLFFDTGAALLLYGSKKIYRQYLLFREFTTNPLIKQCKYYQDNVVLYVMADILVTMRKEVGLSYFNSIGGNEALAFFVNDVSSNPVAKENAMEAKFRIKMIRFELAVIDRTKFIYTKRLYTSFIKPVFAGTSITLKYLVVIPYGRLIAKLFPKCAEKVQAEHSETK